MKPLKIIRIVLGSLVILSIPLLYVGSCASAISDALNKTTDSSTECAANMIFILLGLGLLSICVGRFLVVKIIIVLGYISTSIYDFLSLGTLNLVLYYGIGCVILSIFYTFDLIYYFINKKKKMLQNIEG